MSASLFDGKLPDVGEIAVSTPMLLLVLQLSVFFVFFVAFISLSSLLFFYYYSIPVIFSAIFSNSLDFLLISELLTAASISSSINFFSYFFSCNST